MSVIKMTDVDLQGKRVLIREDLNVPVADGEVTSDARIRAALPTIRAALDAGAAVMLMSHLGRPTEGQPENAFSLQPVAARLAKLLERDVPLVKDWIDGVEVAAGDVVLLENVRFLAGEKACDEGLPTAHKPAPTALQSTPLSPALARYCRQNWKHWPRHSIIRPDHLSQ